MKPREDPGCQFEISESTTRPNEAVSCASNYPHCHEKASSDARVLDRPPSRLNFGIGGRQTSSGLIARSLSTDEVDPISGLPPQELHEQGTSTSDLDAGHTLSVRAHQKPPHKCKFISSTSHPAPRG